MTTIGFEAGGVLLLLLPGLISARIVQAFSATEERREFEQITNALIYTFVIALSYAALVPHLPVEVTSWSQNGTTHYGVEVLGWRVLILLGLAVLWGSAVTVCANKDIPWKWLRKWGLTGQSARSSLWHDVFYEYAERSYAQVQLKDGRFLLGYVRHYSQADEDPCLFIEEASWISRDDENEAIVLAIPGPGILLMKDSVAGTIMFLHPRLKEEQKSAAAVAG